MWIPSPVNGQANKHSIAFILQNNCSHHHATSNRSFHSQNDAGITIVYIFSLTILRFGLHNHIRMIQNHLFPKLNIIFLRLAILLTVLFLTHISS